ncbi:hypothetical protein [Magnetovibrio sp.]|uniref:hypothetical protein n=1 Tax=Magnetovibrio sp. TaxID=2024836 RepID=UPI002F91D2AC
MALSDFQDLVDDLVRDSGGKITTADRDQAIALAVLRYSKDRPRVVTEDVTCVAGSFQALPASWEAEFSVITELEYPIGNVPPALLNPEGWDLYQGLNGFEIMLAETMAADATLRVRFTAKHTVDGVTDTVPEHDREAVSAWAAAVLLDQLAALHTGKKQSTLKSDSVDHGSIGGGYARRAKEQRQRYFDELGLDPKRNVAAGAVVNLQMDDSRGRDRLTHPRRFR